MNILFIHPFKIKLVPQQEEHPLVTLHETPDRNTSEGGEFLDDALRMDDDMALTSVDNFKTEKS